MTTDLLGLPARELLGKFGAGNHKPGSGSAAAYQGLMACALLKTVTQITLDREKYSDVHEDMTEIHRGVVDVIEPKLEIAFRRDSDVFDQVIQTRLARREEADTVKKSQLNAKHLKLMTEATEIPLEIAKDCMELTRHGLRVLKHGYKAVRGDSGVATSTAISGVQGAIAIIQLNLLSFNGGAKKDEMKSATDLIVQEIRELQAEYGNVIQLMSNEQFVLNASKLRREVDTATPYSDKELEFIARRLHHEMFKNQEMIWKKSELSNSLKILDPLKALNVLGFQTALEPLGQFDIEGSRVEVAGLIDREVQLVKISTQFNPQVMNFTAAHELGHCILHRSTGVHRDRPLSFANSLPTRERTEREADKFASYFLMPLRQVVPLFREVFQTEKFKITDDSSAAFPKFGSKAKLQSFCGGSRRKLARELASCENYNGVNRQSLADLFKVSDEAMAIRLEELELVEL